MNITKKNYNTISIGVLNKSFEWMKRCPFQHIQTKKGNITSNNVYIMGNACLNEWNFLYCNILKEHIV